MNEVVPDWLHREDTTRASGTALPNTYIGDNAELNALRTTVALLQDENRHLKAENAELREKCMTNMERIQTADKVNLASMILKIYDWGITDSYGDYPSPLNGAEITEDVERWLDRTEFCND